MSNKTNNDGTSTDGLSNRWGQDIDRAMQQIENPTVEQGVIYSRSYYLPYWFPYVTIAVLVVVIFSQSSSYNAPHPMSDDRDFETGPRVAMLMLAEDVERYRDTEGKLPDELPGALGDILDVHYEKVDKNTFELRMNTDISTLIFNDNTKSISIH